MKLNNINILLLFGFIFSINGEVCASLSFDFTDKSAAQSALSGKKFCKCLYYNLGRHWYH